MKLIDAILKSLNDLKSKATAIEVYSHIVENNYFNFGEVNTPIKNVGFRLWDFIRTEDPRVRYWEDDGVSYYYLAKHEQEIIFKEYRQNLKTIKTNRKSLNLPTNNASIIVSHKNEILDVMILRKPAVKIRQGDLTIYATSFKVKDLLIKDFWRVDKLDPTSESPGFQRSLDIARTKKLADYILKAWEDRDAFLPTSIFLATDKDVFFDEEKNEITFEVEKVCPFNVVDGQHRVQGLIEAALQNPEIQEFELLANIAVNLDNVAQMCHFLIVNTTQKSVNKAVEQQIIARLSGMVSIEDIPTLPKWIQKQVDKGEDKEALVITNYLINEPDSPWYRRIRMANADKKNKEAKNEKIIPQESFVQSIKVYILNPNNPIYGEKDSDKRNRILKNYWKAISELLVNKEAEKESILFLTNGLELFNIVSVSVFNKLYSEQNFTVSRIKEIFKHGFANLEEEFFEIQNPEWWESGNGATTLNKAAIRRYTTDLNRAINVQSSTADFKI